MEYKEYYSVICLALINTNELNDKYCSILQYAFKPQKIEYVYTINDLRDIENQLISLKSHQYTACKEITEKTNDEFSISLIDLLDLYQYMLLCRIGQLTDIVFNLFNKSERKNKYGYFTYRSDLKVLEEMEYESSKTGGELQVLAEPFLKKYYKHVKAAEAD